MTEMEYCKGKISLEELLYYILFSIILFTKAIGLDEGSSLFRCCLMLGVLLFGCKLVVGKYSITELILMGLLGLWGIFTFRFTGSLGMFIYIVLIIGMKNVSVKRTLYVGTGVWGACMLYTVTAAVFFGRTGVRIVHEKLGLGSILRESLGYTHPNVLHITYIVFMAFVLYLCWDNKKKLFTAIILLLFGDAYIFLYSVSFTGLLFSFVLLILVFYFQNRKKFSLIETASIGGLPIICIFISIVLPLLMDGGIFYKVINKILNNRLWAIRTFFQYYRVSLFGGRNEGIDFSLDNSYVFALNGYGVIPLFIIVLTYILLLRYYLKKNRRAELAIICAFLIAGLSEPFLFNASVKNITVIFIGEFLFEIVKGKGCVFDLLSKYNRVFYVNTFWIQKISKKVLCIPWRKGIIIAGVIGGLCFWGLLSRDCVSIDQVYVDEELCHVGGETVPLPKESIDKRTLYIEGKSEDLNYYLFSRDNSRLIEIMDLRLKISISIYVSAALLMIWVYYRCSLKDKWKGKKVR